MAFDSATSNRLEQFKNPVYVCFKTTQTPTAIALIQQFARLPLLGISLHCCPCWDGMCTYAIWNNTWISCTHRSSCNGSTFRTAPSVILSFLAKLLTHILVTITISITFTVIFILTLSKGATCGVKAFITSVILLACLHSNPESDYAHSSLKRDTEKITSTKHVIQYSILINHNG